MNNRFKNFIPKAIYWLMYLLLGRVIVFYINQNDKFAIKCYFNFSDKYFLLEFIAAIFSATFWTYIIFKWAKKNKH